ncbi:MAG TPA: hypothetical protein VJI46_05030 [Candidatus Nanoarchaeia archaeon]|nr:hypothetical protein [Candidatus Nanoarchaeia archaeon]
MLDEKRVQEAEKNLKRYLEEGLIAKAKNDLALKRYMTNSDLSLETAERLSKLDNFLLLNVLHCKCGAPAYRV